MEATDGAEQLDALNTALSAEIEDAATFIDSEIGPARAIATKFYRGDLFGDEEQGRSQVVMPLVRDTARATLPYLVRMFMGTDRVVEFDPGAVGQGEFAEDATSTVNYVLLRQNDGFKVFWSAFKDALVRKTGWVKWWWDDSSQVTTKVFEGVTEDQLLLTQQSLGQYEQLQIMEREQVGTQPVTVPVMGPHGQPMLDPQTQQVMTQQIPQPVFEYKIHLVSRKPVNQVRVAAVPPEEVIISRDATDEYGARLIAHRTLRTRSDLVAMGISEDDLEDMNFNDNSLDSNLERLERLPTNLMTSPALGSPDQAKILFYDCFYRYDFDGDGISELRQVWALGSEKKIVRNEPADEVPLALFCPDPEPHVVFGLSQADSLMDLQILESHIWRDSLDSLKASIFPRMAYVEGQANVDDVLNTEIGAAIRMRAPGMVTPLEVPFVGQQAYPMLDRLAAVREQRTGVSMAAIGLDPGALQSTNQIAVTAAVTGAQAQIDLIARIFAETGMKRLFRGVLRLLTRHQDNEMQFRLNGRSFQVNPAKWNPDMDIIVSTGLGTGMPEQKLQVLSQVATVQNEAMSRLGIDNPLCSLQEFYNTWKKMLELSGLTDVHRYFRDPTEAVKAGKQVQPPQPSPEATIAQAQMQIEQLKAHNASLEMLLTDDRERDRMEIEATLEAYRIKAQYGASVDVAALSGLMAHKRTQLQVNAQVQQQVQQPAQQEGAGGE